MRTLSFTGLCLLTLAGCQDAQLAKNLKTLKSDHDKLRGEKAELQQKLDAAVDQAKSLQEEWKRFQESHSPEIAKRLTDNALAAENAAKSSAKAANEAKRLKNLCVEHEKAARESDLVKLTAVVKQLQSGTGELKNLEGDVRQLKSDYQRLRSDVQRVRSDVRSLRSRVR